MKEPVRLRQKALANGNISLYLDFYVNGRRSYEFLKLYLVPERTRDDRERNRQTLQLANSVKARRLVDVQNRRFGFESDAARETLFFDYFAAVANEARESGHASKYGLCIQCLRWLEMYDGNVRRLTFADITQRWLSGFRDFLSRADGRAGRRLSRNTQSSYFARLRFCVNRAYRERVIPENPLAGIGCVRPEEGRRMFLTVDEVRQLMRTECRSSVVRRAFLFSCLTGLRHSDIVRLTWGEVQPQGAFTRIVFKQKKTGGLQYLDISPQAAGLMGERGGEADCPFAGMPSFSFTEKCLRLWMAAAGIGKHITFHCARHIQSSSLLKINKLQKLAA